MTILDYSRCEICSDMKTALTPTLTKVVPDLIVDNVLSFNCCEQYEFLRKRGELYFIEEHFNSKVEGQICCFECLRLGTQTPIAHRIYPTSKFKDNLKDFIEIIDRSSCSNKKVLKSYIKKCFRTSFQLINLIHNKEIVKDYIKHKTNILIMNYSYYRKWYSDRNLCKTLMYEYLLYSMGRGIVYINTDDLNKYLDDVFDEA